MSPFLETTTAEHLLAKLKAHVGRANAATSIQLAREMGWTDGTARVVRALIQLHRNNDWPGVLLAEPGVDGGYYFAQDMAEIEAYRKHLAADVRHAKANLKKFDERVAKEGFALEEAA